MTTMKTRTIALLGMAALFFAPVETLAREAAVSRTLDDAGLTWGPCPPVLPAPCEVAVLHGDPAAPHADVFLRLPAGYAIPAHKHTSAEHMILVAGELQVTYAGQKPLTLRAGSYAYGPAQVAHAGQCVSDRPCVLFIAFESPMDAEGVASLTE